MARKPNFSLDQAIADPGFTPSQKDVGPLLDLLLVSDSEAEPHVLRALNRLGNKALEAALARAPQAGDEAKGLGKLVRLIGQLMRGQPSAAGFEWLIGKLGHTDSKVRSIAANALGKLGDRAAEDALIQALSNEREEPVRRVLVQALGYVGGEKALDILARVETRDSVSEQRKSRAALMVSRDLGRGEVSSFDASKPAFTPVPVIFRFRPGMEDFLCDELSAALEPALQPKVCRDLPLGLRVEAKLLGAPEDLFRARLFMSFGFALPEVPIASPEDVPAAVIAALSSSEAWALLSHWTQGPLRYRLSWAKGGKRRAAVFHIASEVSKRRPGLQNDPRESLWQAVVYESKRAVRVELVPRLSDPRFAYRAGDVPAASHPTIAALIAHVSGVRADDVVWDPFVGSGLELCERSLRGPYQILMGSDRDEDALKVANINLGNAKALHFKLFQHDIRDALPAFDARPTLVMSNPPMGLRLHRSATLLEVLDAFIARSAEALAVGGRLVWISPMPERTAINAKRAGLVMVVSKFVDMGGFEAQLQAFTKVSRGKKSTP